MYKIGITGGIGAGKSTVSYIFAVLDIPVYNSDERAKALMSECDDVRRAIIDLIGPDSFSKSGQLNREFISKKVFGSRWMLNRLNAIVHPAVDQDYRAWHASQTNCPYTIKEAALIFDAGIYLELDATILVSADLDTRIGRVMKRDGRTRAEIMSRIASQWPEDRRLQIAEYVIDNSGGKLLAPQVLSIHHILSSYLKPV